MISLGYSSCRNHRCYNMMSFVIYILLVILHSILFNGATAAAHSVSTYKKASLVLNQLITSSTLEWEPYKLSLESKSKQLEFAIQGSIFKTEDEHYPIYICRINMDGVPRSGFTEKRGQNHVCKVAYLNTIKPYNQFDVLVNKGKLGKVSWKKWKRYEDTPDGAVSVNEYTFVARHKVRKEDEKEGSEYDMGRLEVTSNNNGKIYVTDSSSKEQHYMEGDVLVEVEPLRYELSDIELDRSKSDIRNNVTVLASTTLSNNEDEPGAIKSLLTYQYDKSEYWGNQNGLVRALKTKIYENGINEVTEINWALKSSSKHEDSKEISSYLYPGTAINVTLIGNITTLEAPYTARLMTHYYDFEKISTKISATVYKKFLGGIRLEFSSAFWIENGTLIPTTTTTTTTSTESVKQVTKDANPILSPPTVTMTDVSTSPKSSVETNEVTEEEVTKQNFAANLAQANILGNGVNSPAPSRSTLSTIPTILFALIVLYSTHLNC